ncbi:hypothetical protein [Marinoscillum furvescens]|uniref:Transglutaminase superfamily protein n=1 Tax=Marinoscillum furvescens DSM 4134 TaxID=1122208 RepID=A0A3D9L2T1_MARFU|nr:hypothetical protein [Marinoscillum furvescens]RED98935.1 hypothetical protein C7460_109127 [Marinoscillum furvescens DSM 4134]
MRKLSCIWLCLLLTLNSSFGQPDQVTPLTSDQKDQATNTFDAAQALKWLLAADEELTPIKYNEYTAEFEELTKRLNQYKQDKSSSRLLEKAFYLTHRKKLKSYTNYVSMRELFEHGKYDCLTGTALFATLLAKLEVDYTIHEFDFHILLIAHTTSGDVLLEATDPLNGFVTQEKEIKKRLAVYREEQALSGETPVANQIGLKEITGLQYFNLAARSFNEGDVLRANELIAKAAVLYPSERIKNMQQIFRNQVLLASSK